MHGGGKSGLCATGFIFSEQVEDAHGKRHECTTAGPLASIQAVRAR